MNDDFLDSPFIRLRAYEMRHLIAHLTELEEVNSVHKIITFETLSGKNAWYLAKNEILGIDAYMDDVRRALEFMQKLWVQAADSGDAVSMMSSQSVLYSLMLGSAVSLVRKVPPGLLSALVTTGIWSEERAIGQALQIKHNVERVRALTELAPVLSSSVRINILREAFYEVKSLDNFSLIRICLKILPLLNTPHEIPELLEEALRALSSMPRTEVDDSPDRGSTWLHFAIRLLPWLSGQASTKTVDGIREIVQTSNDSQDMVSGLVALIPYAETDEQQTIVRETAELVINGRGHAVANAGVALADWLVTAGRVADAIEIMRSAVNADIRSRMLVKLGQYMVRHGLKELLAIVQNLPAEIISTYDDSPLAYALRGLLPYLPQDLRQSAVESLLRLAWTESPISFTYSDEPSFQVKCLGAAFPYLTGEKRIEILDSVVEILRSRGERNEHTAEDAPAEFWASLKRNEIYKILEKISRVADDEYQIIAKSRLAQYEDFQSFLWVLAQSAQSITVPRQRLLALVMIASRLPDEQATRIFTSVLGTLETLDNAQDVVNTLEQIAGRIPPSYIQAALKVAHKLPSSDHRGGRYNPRDIALSTLVPRMAEVGLIEEALAITRNLTDTDYYGFATCPLANAICGISSWLSEDLLSEVLALTKRISRKARQAKAMASVSSSYARKGNTARALDIARSIDPQTTDQELIYWKFVALANILTQCNETNTAREVHDEAAAILGSIEEPTARGFALAVWIPAIPADNGRQYLGEALRLAADVERVNGRVGLLMELMKSIEIFTPREARIAAAGAILDSSRRDRSDVLLDLGVLMPLLIKAGGAGMAATTWQAVTTVSQWWP
jgi:hypothetical protein